MMLFFRKKISCWIVFLILTLTFAFFACNPGDDKDNHKSPSLSDDDDSSSDKDSSFSNISADGFDICYTDSVNGDTSATYTLSGGGTLAPCD